MPDDKTSPSTDDKEQKAETTPDSGGPGQVEKKSTEAPSKELPEKLQGKSPDEIAKMYVELERKMGEQSTTVSEAKKLKEQTDIMLRAIWSDPDLYRQVETGIQKYLTGDKMPETRGPKQGDEDTKRAEVTPEVADLRKAEENRILNEFYREFGYDALEDKDRQDRFTKTAVVMAELLDPSGTKSVKEIVSGVSLDRLPKYLRYAHRIAHSDETVEQARRSALLSAEENRAASIGSFAASSGKKGEGVELSNREREVALKMGITPEEYAKQKAKIQEELKTFE